MKSTYITLIVKTFLLKRLFMILISHILDKKNQIKILALN
ncbi:hypothetical protein NT05LM_0258 [Listeria marthii FSL S4-120]|uniref:Uncharacterized protein n=1 Tax=Listeria marthii FSL S4-120 TaxID=702457 RepID=A0ABN0C0V0_9LIST|nr:hypothetical protein NT05LM_0258 [Listeria marthii FSL S4-120]